MTHHLHDLPSDAHTVLFSGAKGGVGTSTVAALHALALARAGFPTALTAVSDTQVADLSPPSWQSPLRNSRRSTSIPPPA